MINDTAPDNDNDRPADVQGSIDRRLAAIREWKSRPAPILPEVIKRPPPRSRRTSVRHRSIR